MLKTPLKELNILIKNSHATEDEKEEMQSKLKEIINNLMKRDVEREM